MNLTEQTRGKKFSVRAEQVHEKAIAQAGKVFEKAKLSNLIEG